jgi:hypothetical protein
MLEEITDLPVHPLTRLRALGVLPSGRIIWPVLGAAEDDGTGDDQGTENEDAGGSGDQEDGSGAEQLGDAGKRAITRERAARKKAQDDLRQAEAKLKQYTDKDTTAAERLAELERTSGDRITGLTGRVAAAEIRARAAEGFADPADAVAFLDAGSYVDDDGEIDIEKIGADLADLLKRKPHLAKQGARGPKRDPSQGAKPGDGELTLGQQIAKAEKDGDIRRAISLKNLQLVGLQK